jgi:hypothetical protein
MKKTKVKKIFVYPLTSDCRGVIFAMMGYWILALHNLPLFSFPTYFLDIFFAIVFFGDTSFILSS